MARWKVIRRVLAFLALSVGSLLFINWAWDRSNELTEDWEAAHRPCKCAGENMCLRAFHEGALVAVGWAFACAHLGALEQHRLLSSQPVETPTGPARASAIPIISFASDDHFDELRGMIHSVRRQKIDAPIIIYDLGLRPAQRAELLTVCGLTTRPLPFWEYPPHFSVLGEYHFKVAVLTRSFAEFERFWIFDASTRIQSREDFLDFYKAVNDGKAPLLGQRESAPVVTSIHTVTDARMYRYLPLDERARRERQMRDASPLFVQRSAFTRDLLKWHLLCALSRHCLAPPHSKVYCDLSEMDLVEDYSGCHRYDQSSLNILRHLLIEQPEFGQLKNMTEAQEEVSMEFTWPVRKGTSERLNYPCEEARRAKRIAN